MATTDLATIATATDLDAIDTIDGLLAAWLLSLTSENTRHAYRRDLSHFVAFCTEHRIDLLAARRPHVDAYARQLDADGLAASTIARRISTLSNFYRYAESVDVIEKNPVALVKRPKVSDHSATFGPDKAQVAAMLDAAAKAGKRDLALISLLVTNGLRVSEAIALDAEHMNTDRGHRVLKVKGKGRRIDTIAIPPRTAAAIDELGIETGPLFTDGKGDRLNRHQVTRIVKRLARAAGIEGKVSPHSLRHSAVTIALDADVPLHIVQDMARHADPRTTRRYDQGRGQLDNHASYAIAGALAN